MEERKQNWNIKYISYLGEHRKYCLWFCNSFFVVVVVVVFFFFLVHFINMFSSQSCQLIELYVWLNEAQN